MATQPSEAVDQTQLQELVAKSDTGGRNPGPTVRQLLLIVAVSWSLFQLWYASPLPFTFRIGIFPPSAWCCCWRRRAGRSDRRW
jgi:TRAP-type uncharacterized transport system fused permease subunit